MKLARLALSVLVIVAVAAPAARGDTTLRYKFKEGEKLVYRTELKSSMTMSVMGQEVTTEFTQSYDQIFTIKSVDKDGKAQFECKFDNFKLVVDAPAPFGRMEFDAKAGKKPEGILADIIVPYCEAVVAADFPGTINAQGEVSDIKVPEAAAKKLKSAAAAGVLGQAFNEDSLKTLITQPIAVFPRDAVAKGKTWNHSTEVKVGNSKMKTDTAYAYDGTTRREGKELDQLNIKIKIAFESDEIKMKVTGQDGKGTILFDNSAGRMVEHTSVHKVDMETESPLGNVTQTMKQTFTAKLLK